MEMFKRKLFKRALPIILSVAMVFETMPATALAAESQTVESTASDETAVPDDAQDSVQNAEPADSANSAEKSGTESGDTPQETGGSAQAETDTAQKEESTGSDTESAPQNADPAESGTAESETAESETEKSETVESESAKSETAESETTEAEAGIEAAADGETPSQTEAETLVTRIVAEDTDFDKPINIKDSTGEKVEYTFTRRLSEAGLDFFTTYREKSGCGKFQEEIAGKIYVEVDGERIDGLHDRLTYKWIRKAAAEGETDQTLTDAVPTDAGRYELVISMDTDGVDGLCKKPEKDLVVSLQIEKAEIELFFSSYVNPVETAQDLIDWINEKYIIQYKGDYTYHVSREILAVENGVLPIHLFVMDKSGKRQPMKATDLFERAKDYVLTIDEIALTEQAGKNYTLSVKEVYPVEVGGLQDTEVRFELKDPGRELIEEYASEKEWKIEDVTKDLFTEPVKEGDTVTKLGGAPAVYIEDEDGKYNTVLEGAVPEAKWYTRIQTDGGYKIDKELGEIEDGDFVYKPMASNPKDAGEYFIIWSYAGDNNAYDGAHSDPLKFTIDPVPVVIKTSGESVAAANFRDGMSYEDIQSALASVSYGVYPKVKNETTGVIETSDKALDIAPDFFGTSYGMTNTDRTQYFVPEFVLQRRVKRITEKGGLTVDIGSLDSDDPHEPRAVDWNTVPRNEDLRIVMDDGFDEISDDELPIEYKYGQSRDKIESIEFEFRVYFTGNKVVYKNGGAMITGVPVTDVTTSAANKNYLADVTKETLEQTAVAVPVEKMKTETVQLVTDGIVDAFIADNKEMLDPQIPDNSTPEAARALHPGTLEQPAVKIFDKNALFKDRASYKKAKVHKLNEKGELDAALPIEPTDDTLEYRWSFTTLKNYEAYLEKWDEEQREYADFNDFYIKNDLGMTNVDDGSLDAFKGAGLYRLTVTYKDPKNEYRAEAAEIFFKVERQEIVIVPSQQYVRVGDKISDWKKNTEQKNEINKDFTIYKLPHNSMEAFSQLTDEAKKGYVLPTAEEIAAYEQKEGRKPDLTLDGVAWDLLRKEKNPETGEDLDPAKWINAYTPYGNFGTNLAYGAVVHWEGEDNGPKFIAGDDFNNYTTLDVKTYRATGEWKHHESVSAVNFYDQQIFVEVDTDKIRALGHEYNGEAVDLKKVSEALVFYTDEALTESSRLSAEQAAGIVNTTDTYNPKKINIYWKKIGAGGEVIATYANRNAVFGGTYRLVLRFEGGELSAVEDKPETAQEDAPVQTYAPLNGSGWITFSDSNEENAPVFTVTPREITITPKTMKAETLFAGDTAKNLLTEGMDVQNLVEKDKKFFEYAEIAAGNFDTYFGGKNEDGTDRESFRYKYNIDKNGGYPAFNGKADYIIQADGRDIESPEKVYLRTNSTYTVKLQNELASPLAESYKVQYGTAAVQITQRGSADIGEIDDKLSAKGISYELNDSIYTIRPRGAVQFYYEDSESSLEVFNRDDETEVLKNTNVLGFRIYAPKEFHNTGLQENFVYKNAVWNAGGYFYGSTEWQESEDDYYIDVVFPLAKEDTERSFSITWEEGYTETFALADLVLEEDLRKAVAPKSIAFNGVAGKMAVGETQQLDLKITKAQLGDVINIRYRLKGGETKNEFISIDPETGIVTALKAGKTANVVEAYPVYKDAKGNFVPVLDKKGKEAKAASAKITVTEVTASAVKKITAQDDTAKIYFTVPEDGYRREIYVVDVTKGTAYADRKKWKPADFNEAIAGIQNGKWKAAGFAKVQYSTAKNEKLDKLEQDKVYDKKLKAHIVTVYGLEAGHEYTVYVRNVSAARALDDGSVVALSANGSVKSFKMTKPMAKKLELGFTVKTDENDKKNTVTHPVNPDGTVDMSRYTVELSAKKAQLNVYGLFSDKAGGNDSAEDQDRRRYSLIPTVKEEKAALKNYQLPKLAFAVYDEWVDEPFKSGQTPSKYAAVSNKGLVTLKGVDLNGIKTVYIYVRDNLQHESKFDYDYDAWISLTITAKPASFAGKKVKMKVGQQIKLSDYLEYKDEKKKKLPNYRSCGVTISKEMIAMAEASGYEIEDNDDAGDKIHDWRITATAPNKTPFDLIVTDYDAEGKPMETTVKLASAQIDPVKGMKVTYVDDQYITINFTHPSNMNEDDDGRVYEYALEVKDARGNVVDKVIISNPNRIFDIDGINAKELKNAQSWIQYDTDVTDTNGRKYLQFNIDDSDQKLTQEELDKQYTNTFNYYTGEKTKTKTFAYTYHNSKLVRLSSYTLSLTPLYENQQAAKAATAKAKTTNIPASRENVDLTGQDSIDRRGGNGIDITSKKNQVTKGANQESEESDQKDAFADTYRFISGNTYTLKLQDSFGELPRDRVSDTLTWKSSNPKTATIKANAGTYTATLKAVSKGRTTITVTSKVTKKVIARWAVSVSAVKDGSSYGGDYEPTWDDGFYENILALYDPYYEGKLEVLTESVPLTIQDGWTWISFTAPHYGEYTFTYFAKNEEDEYWEELSISEFYDSRNGRIIYSGDRNSIFLEANQKVYFKLEGAMTVKVEGEEFARLSKEHTKEAPLEVKAGYVAFTAWEDNWYTVYFNGKEHEYYNAYSMQAGKTIYIRAEVAGKMYVVAEAEPIELGSASARTVKLDKDNQKEYISFTAKVAGAYKLTYDKVKGTHVSIKGSMRSSEAAQAADTDSKETRFITLKEGETICLLIEAESEITDAKKEFSITVSVEAEERRKVENSTITIPKGNTEIVEYVIPAFTTEKAQFIFAVTGEEGTKISAYYDQDYNIIRNVNANTLTVSKASDAKLKAGDSIYIEIEAGAGKAGDDKAKDAVLTVVQVPVTTLADTSTVSIDNQTQQWYTFTAPKAGFYEFGVKVAARAANDKTPVHNAVIRFYQNLFDPSPMYEAVSADGTKILSMKAGQTVALQLKSDNKLPDITKEDGTEEPVKSDVTVSVKALDVKPLSVNKGEHVELPAKSEEARYYSFTAAVGATYEKVWEPSDSKTDNAKVTMLTSIEQVSDQASDGQTASVDLKVGDVRYIKVEIQDPESDNPVNGTLTVKAENLNADTLTAGQSYPFHLEYKGGKDAEKVVKFTAPVKGEYEVTTVCEKNEQSGLSYELPSVKVLGSDTTVSTPNDTVEFEKGETKYFRLSFKSEGEVRETKGTITVTSLAKPLDKDVEEIKVTYDTTKTFKYIIPESGRYEFKAEYDEEIASVTWNYGEDTAKNGNYYKKNTELTVEVEGTDEGITANVKLYKPSLISTTSFNAGKNKLELKAGETKYYELSTTEAKKYSFEVTDLTNGTAIPEIKYVTGKTANNWDTLSVDRSYTLPKNSSMILKVTSPSAKKGVSCSLDITENTALKLGDNAVTIDAGASVTMTYRALEAGYYSFSVNQPDAQLVLKVNNGTPEIGSSFYECNSFSVGASCDYTITNEGSTAVTLTVTIKEIEPVVLEPGKEEPKAKDVALGAGEKIYFELKSFKKSDYCIKITDTSKGEDLWLSLDRISDFSQYKTADGYIIDKELNGKKILTIRNDGIKETKVSVEFTVSETQPLTADPVTLGKNEIRKFSYLATEDNRYLISRNNDDKDLKLNLSVKRINGNGETDLIVDEAGSWEEIILNKGDKLIGTLSYKPTDEKAKDTQTVTVTIAPVQPVNIDTETIPENETTKTVKLEPVTIGEKDNPSRWYQFNAAEDATYQFALTDAYGNPIDNGIHYYNYITDKVEKYLTENEQYMKAGSKLYINVNCDETYTLQYTASKAVTQTGVQVLDFEYKDEVQEVKFVVPRGGIYKISATAIRGSFDVSAKLGKDSILENGIPSFTASGSKNTTFLNQDDVVTIKVTAQQSGKASVSLRIDEVSTADTLALGKEVSGIGNTKDDSYYEFRADKEGLYAITAIGEPAVTYSVEPFMKDENSTLKPDATVTGTEYTKLNAGDRVVVKVAKGTEKAYTLKIEMVNTISLDGGNTEEKPFDVTAADGYYGFTTEKAYVRYTIPADGDYYIAVQPINNSISVFDETWSTPQTDTARNQANMYSRKKDETVTFTLTSNMPKDNKNPEKYEEAQFRLIVRKADADLTISVNETKAGTLDSMEKASYTFTATEDGTYIIRFEGSNCTLDSYSDGKEIELKKDEKHTFTIQNNTWNKAGIYQLTVTKLNPTALTSGVTAEGTLEKNQTVYYQFTSTEAELTGYQVYISGTEVQSNIKYLDKDGAELSNEQITGNAEYNLNKDEKLVLKVKNTGTKNTGFKVTVKKIEYTPVNADTPVSRTLDAYEKAYYEFTEGASETGVTYHAVLDSESDKVNIGSIQVARIGADGNLGAFEALTDTERKVTLKKGEKLRLAVLNKNNKNAGFELTVKDLTEPEITYEPLALNETKFGKLIAEQKAGYEFTAGDAAEDGTAYTIFFDGETCKYSHIITVKGEDNSSKEEVAESDKLGTGSKELTLKKGDKVRFTVSGAGKKYELSVKKVVYTPLTLGKTATRTLRVGESVYYEFTDTAAEEKKTTTYHVFGSSYSVSKVTVNEDKSTTVTALAKASEYELGKGESLRFKVTNTNTDTGTVNLTIRAVEYSAMALDTPAEGRLKTNEYAYYQYTSQEDPAEGETAVKYHIYGTAKYQARTVTVNEDQSTTATAWTNNAAEVSLKKGQTVQFRVTGQDSYPEGYSLAITKFAEKPITIGATEQGSLAKGQKLVYAYTYTGETPASYIIAAKENGTTIAMAVNGTSVEAQEPFVMKKDEKLTVTITSGWYYNEDNSYKFTVREFQPETLTPGTQTAPKILAEDGKMYYQYKVPEGGEGSYMLVLIANNADALEISGEVAKAGSTEGAEPDEIWFDDNGITSNDISLVKDDVLRVTVEAYSSVSYRLLLQKAAKDTDKTALPWKGEIRQGEVKYFKFTKPAEDKADYLVSIPYVSDKLIYTLYDDAEGCVDCAPSKSSPYFTQVSGNFTLRVVNASLYNSAECRIDVQKKEAVGMGTQTGTLEPNAYQYFVFPGNIAYTEDEETGEPKVKPYYISVPDENKCTLEWRDARKQWKSLGTCMNTQGSDYIVRIHNTGSQTSKYAFTLKNAMRDTITAPTDRNDTLEQNEAAYYTITAPEKQAFYITASSEDSPSVYCDTELYELLDGYGQNIGLGEKYGVAAGKTCYVKAVSTSEDCQFTINVTETNVIPLELNTASQTVYIPKGGKAEYEFTAQEDGDYIVLVDGNIQYGDHNYTYVDGTENLVFENGHVFEGLAAGKTLRLNVENTSSYGNSRSCRIRLAKYEETSDKTIEPGVSDVVVLTEDRMTATYTFTAPESGRYVFYAVTDQNKRPVTIQVNESSRAGRYQQMYVTQEMSAGDRTELTLTKDEWDLPDMFTFSCFKLADELQMTGVTDETAGLSENEAVLVEWKAGDEGKYQFGFDAGQSSVEYWYSPNLDFNYYNVSHWTGTSEYWNSYEYEDTAKYLILKAAEDNTEITISASIVPPTRLELNKQTTVQIRRDELEFVTFEAAGERTRYKFTTGNPDVVFYDIDNDSSKVTFEQILGEGDGEQRYRLKYNGSSTETEAHICVSSVETEPISDGMWFTVPAYDVAWYEFMADRAASYTFEVESDDSPVNFTLYKSMTGSSLGGGARWLEENEKILVRIENKTSHENEYRFTATVKDPVYRTVETLEEGDAKTISFTAPETGTYTYVAYTTDNGRFRVNYENNSFTVWEYNNKDNAVRRSGSNCFMEGETVELELVAESADSHTIAFRVEPQKTAVKITNAYENTYPLVNGNNYFEYTAANDGYYMINAGGGYSSLSYCINATNSWRSCSNKQMIKLNRDDKVFLKTYTYDSSSMLTLKLGEAEFTPISADEPETPYELAGNEEAYYQFTAPETGKYVVNLRMKNNGSVYAYPEGENGGFNESNFSDSKEFELAKDEKLLLRVRNNYSSTAKYTLTAKKIEYQEVSSEEQSEPCRLAARDVEYYQFTAPEAGQYVVNLKQKNNVSISVYPEGENGGFGYNFSGSKEFELAKDEKLILRVRNDDYSSVATYTLTAKKIEYQPLSLEEQTEPYSLDAGDVAYYQFTAEEAGIYAVKNIYVSNSPSYYYADENGSYVSYNDGKNFEMQNGDSFMLKVVAYAYSDVQYKLAVSKVETNEVTLDEPLSKELEAQKDTFFRFKALSDGWYAVSVNPNNVNVYYAVNDGNYSDANNGRVEAYLTAGNELWLRVNSSSGQTVEVKAEEIEFQRITGEQEIFTQQYETKYYQYEAEADGKYAIEITGTSVRGYYVDKNSTDINNYFDGRVFDLEEGDSVRIKVQNNSYEGTENPFTISVKKKDTTPTLITGEVNESYSLLAQEEQYFEYTVNETGLYNITIDDDLIRCNYANAQGNYYQGFDTECAFQLIEGQKFLFKLVNMGSQIRDTELKVGKVDTKSVETMSVEDEVLLNFTTYGQTEWRAVSIMESGSYKIAAVAGDNSGYFKVEGICPNNTSIGYISGSENNLYLYNLSVGDTIYIKVYPSSSTHISNPDQSYEHNINITATKN